MIGFPSDEVELSGTIRAVCADSPDEELQCGPYTGPPSLVCEKLAGEIPAEHDVTAELLEELLLAGRRDNLPRGWRQAIAIETHAGWLIATFGPQGAQPDTAGTRRPGPVRFADVEWTTHRGRRKRKEVPDGRRALHRRIADTLPAGFSGRRVQTYLGLAVAADRGARVHKLRLRAAEHPTAAAVVGIVERREIERGLLKRMVSRRCRCKNPQRRKAAGLLTGWCMTCGRPI